MFSSNTSHRLTAVIPPVINYLVIAGGGGGGSGTNSTNSHSSAGGGGAGGLIESPYSLIGYDNIRLSFIIGAGGAGGLSTSSSSTGNYGTNGGNGTFSIINQNAPNTPLYDTTIYGGGGGAPAVTSNVSANGLSGGSGGGGVSAKTTRAAGGAVTTAGQGFAGGYCGPWTSTTVINRFGAGGGGAGGIGGNVTTTTPVLGGIGKISSITGSPVEYAKGGPGGNNTSTTFQTTSVASGFGSGGQGCAIGSTFPTSKLGQSGSSGIVIISYSNEYALAKNVTGSYTYQEIASMRVYSFTYSSGNVSSLRFYA